MESNVVKYSSKGGRWLRFVVLACSCNSTEMAPRQPKANVIPMFMLLALSSLFYLALGSIVPVTPGNYNCEYGYYFDLAILNCVSCGNSNLIADETG